MIARLSQFNTRHPRLLKLIGLAVIIFTCLIIFTGCSDYPGADPPCTGSQKNAPGCTPPATNIKDDPNGGDWYIDWTFKIVRDMLSNLAIQAVNLSVSVFWSIYTGLGSTDFAGCRAGNGAGTAACTAVDTFEAIRTVALVFIPAIMVYRTFKSYFIGNLIEGLYESFLSIAAKVFIAVVVMAFLDVLITGAFGISNQLFNAITGGPQGLNDIASSVVGHGWDPTAPPGSPGAEPAIGVASIAYVKNIGLMIFSLLVCLILAVVFILLGLVFLLRTILVFILFALSPLGIVASTVDEFKPWFYKWLQSLQAMLIAPIPVAVCFRLVGSFAKNVPSAHDNPPEFILTLIYIIAFLAIGTLLMFKIAGALGGVMFGALTAVAGFAVGGIVGAMGASRLSQAVADSDEGEVNADDKKKTASRNQTRRNSGAELTSGATSDGNSTGGMYALQEIKQQAEMTLAMRTMAEALKAGSFGAGSGGISPAVSRGSNFSHLAQQNIQGGLHWAGQEAGISAPRFSFAPQREAHYGNRGNSSNLILIQPGQTEESPYSSGPLPPPAPPPAAWFESDPPAQESAPPPTQWPTPEPATAKPAAATTFVERKLEGGLNRLENSLLRRGLSA